MAGDGAGGFGPPQPLPATAVWDLAVADLDGDGDRDIATANHDTHDLSLLIAEGDGFANTKEGGWPWFSWNQSPTRVQAADVDGDGAPDLVVTKSQKSTLSLLHSNGAGGFLPPDDFGPVDVQQPDLELGDMNEDGTLDLVAKLVHLNDGDGHFTPGVSVAEAEVSYSLMGGLELADMDGDGHLDVVFSADVYDPIDADATGLITRAGDGAGGLGSSQVFPAKLFVVATPDLDGDGLRDVLCWGGDSGLMAAFGDGAGDFTHTRAWAPCLLSGQAVGDIDNDGRPDLVLGDGVQPGLVTLLHRETPFAWADLGHALPGAAGAPRLDGHGPLQPATPLFVQVDQLPHDALLTLVVGGSQLAAPFLGGVLVPSPDRILTGLPTGPEGFLALEGTWPAGLPSGFQLWFQAWVPDPSAPKGWAASNALRTTSP